MTRTIAEDKGYDFGMIGSFKGASFMKLETFRGDFVNDPVYSSFEEKKVMENGVDIRGYDPEVNFIKDWTVIDGEFQDERYFGHRINDIRNWLDVEPMKIDDEICMIGFRGGEYTAFPDLFLPKSYWGQAIALKRAQSPNIRFQVHTDDPSEARKFFPDFEVIHDIGTNWRSFRFTKHAIIANSSFYILPCLINPDVEVIAPRYWARHNTKTWALPQNYYKSFLYI